MTGQPGGENRQDDKKPRPRAYGCGCSLPTAGLVLVALIAVLALVIANRTGLKPSPLWLLLVPLVLGVVVLFFRIRTLR